MTAVPLATIATFINFQDIPCVEGTISKLYPPKTGVGQYGPWTLQGGEITDGNLSHKIVFTLDGGADQYKGKNIKIEAGLDGRNKLCDLVLSEREYQGKAERQIKVGKRAKITILEGSSASPVSSPSQTAATQPRATSVAGNGIPAGDSTVAERVDAWFQILNVVCDRAGQDMGEIANKFSPSDLKEITTGISMSYKGQYGVYAPPYFGVQKQSPASWQDFMYPASGGKPSRRLGDIPETDQLRYVTWALGIKSDAVKPEQKEVWDQVMAMAEAKGWMPEEPAKEEEEDQVPW